MSATIQHVFQAVVIAKLTYASQSWSGFTSAADIQLQNAFLHRSIHQGFCPPDLTDITDIFDAADEALFCQTLHHPNHLLAPCSLMKPTHHTTSGEGAIIGSLLQKSTNYDSNFIQCMLYKDLY